MKRTTALIALMVAALLGAQEHSLAQRPTGEGPQALRQRLEQRYNVVPITNGIALTPKSRRGDVRLIEVSDAIAVNGTVVTGAELRERIGSDADAILQLSYMDPATREALFAATPRDTAPLEPQQAPAPQPADVDRSMERRNRAHGDRVNVFGDVRVREDEEVTGQVVAVLGSVRIDGVVGDQVVAVLGSVELGPKAVVRGDIISVGGRVHRSEGAQVRGGVTEVSLGHVELPSEIAPWLAGVGLFSAFGAVPRLIGTTFRLLLLMTLGVLAYLVARRTVEQSAERVQDNPAKVTIIGLAAGLLIGPVIFLAAFVLILTIIGIPLLLLVPFIFAFLLLLALAGFTGTALAIGQWASRRFGFNTPAGIGTVVLGIVVIFLPLMLARVIALGGWATAPFSFVFGAAAFGLELLVWAAGFGAVLSNTFGGWRARRAMVATP